MEAALDPRLPATFPENFGARPPLSGVTQFHRRRLPHISQIGTPVFLTWRLQGSLPENRVFPAGPTSGRAFAAMDKLLDQARSGPVYLRRGEIASLVSAAIRYREAQMKVFRLHAFTIMPNHVHLLITPEIELSQILQSLKRYTARAANQILGFTGRPFWQAESFDHLVRDEREFQKIVGYIEWNPVKAGLATSPGQFPFTFVKPGL